MKQSNFLGLCSVPALVQIVTARPRSDAAVPPFPLFNATSFKGTAPNSTSFNGTVDCFPFEDPDCCINWIVCQCHNGTFFSANQNNLTNDFCTPPGARMYGEDISSVPGWCC
ncbi:hypothetical protein F4809DRAFT_268433 [Biscogniauxia mediterranea]|nr:hypothetical protein F4809DRAFT_268433 [Biscogniauxia mediterranea]